MKRLFLALLASLDILHHVVTTTTKPPGEQRGSARASRLSPSNAQIGCQQEAPAWGAQGFLSHEAALISCVW